MADLAALYAAAAYWLFWYGLSDPMTDNGREQAAAAIFSLIFGPIALAVIVAVVVVSTVAGWRRPTGEPVDG